MKLVIGTRASKLALAQSRLVQHALLAAHTGLEVTLEHITTRGDIILDRPLSAIGDKGLFITEIEEAMRAGQVDIAVHSAKDLPSELPADMALVAFPRRADARDALVSLHGQRLMELPAGACVGTSSLRRACQLRHVRPDLQILDLRGNVDTRLRKLHEGQYDAIVLAAAGLERLGLLDEVSEFLDPAELMIPAVSQGIIAIEARSGDTAIHTLLAALDDPAARCMATAERAFLAYIGGGCQVPLAAHAILAGETLHLTGMIGSRDGQLVRGVQSGASSDAAAIGTCLAERLLSEGGRELLSAVLGEVM
jgi:hydroxymethylbilane synthase